MLTKNKNNNNKNSPISPSPQPPTSAHHQSSLRIYDTLIISYWLLIYMYMLNLLKRRLFLTPGHIHAHSRCSIY